MTATAGGGARHHDHEGEEDSARTRAEADLSDARDRVVEAERRVQEAGGHPRPVPVPLDASVARLLDTLPVLGWAKDAAGRYAYVNPRLAERFGLPAKEWAGRSDNELGLGPREAAALRRNDRKVLATGESVVAVERASTRWVDDRPFLVIKFPVRLCIERDATPGSEEAAAGHRGVGGIAVEVAGSFTEQQQLAQALAAAGAGSWSWTPAEDRLELSDACWALIGLEPQTLPPTGQVWIDRIHPADVDRLRVEIERCQSGAEGAYREVIRLKTREGGWRHVLTSARVVDRESDGSVRRFTGILLDVEPLKRLELELLRKNNELAGRVTRSLQDLEESEERFQRLAEGTSLMLWTAGPAEDGQEELLQTLWLNPELESFLGPGEAHPLDGRRVLAEQVAEMSRRELPPADADAAADSSERPSEAELPVIDARGRRRWVVVRGQPRRTRDGRLLGRVGTVEDVTERREAREALLRSRDGFEALVADRTAELAERVAELAERNRELDRFTHIASHDMRSPIRSVNSYASLLAREVEPGTPSAKYLDRILRAGRRMSDLLDALLVFAAVGRGRLAAAPVDLSGLVLEALEDLPPGSSGDRPSVSVGPLPEVEGDAVMLRQVFVNLLNNAVKYAGDRPPRVEVTAEVFSAEGAVAPRVRVLVADAGEGIDPQEANRLFEPFERGADPRVPGSGVGLSIVKRVIERHAGTVRATLEPDRMLPTCFWVELPLRQPPPAAGAVEVPGAVRG